MKMETLFNIPPTGKRISKRKAPSLDKIKVNHAIAKDRYYLHRRLDKEVFKIDGASRSIDCSFTSFEDIPVGPRYYVGKLIELGYNVQYKLGLD